MLFNVATLLREPVGSTRLFEVDAEEALVPTEDYRRAVSGSVRMLRTQRGILVRAGVEVRPSLECARCLRPFEAALPLAIDELFVFTRDPVTHEPVEGIELDDFRIEHEQYLDLSEAVRQYEEAARPISPLCEPECRGLCSVCGTDLNVGACECGAEPDDRWSPLAALAERLQTAEVAEGVTEEIDGRPQA